MCVCHFLISFLSLFPSYFLLSNLILKMVSLLFHKYPPRDTIFVEKIRVTQLVKKFTAHYDNPRLIIKFT